MAQGPILFGWGHKAAIEQRAQRVARMLFFIKHGMQTKTYDQFVASFSNPGDEPDVLKRYDRRARFTMNMSASCWYSAQVSFPHGPNGAGSITLRGGGDDFGVLITARPDDDLARVKLQLPLDQKAGREAKSMVRMLEAMPKWTRAGETERILGIEL
jgi:hypothetical protein